MSKSAVPLAIGAALAAAATWPAVAGASPPTVCTAGNPSIVVHVAGFKEPAGKVKITLYGSDADLWLAKGGRISKIDVPVTGRSMDICVPVPAPGRYALAVHHDLNVNGKRDQRDGGGYSRDPKVSLFNPKPPYAKAAFTVGNGPSRVGVTLLYFRGLSVGRVSS